MELFKDYPDVVTISDVMKMLNIGRTSVYKLLRSNQISHRAVGKKNIIPKNAVIDFLNPTCNNNNPGA